MLISLGSVSSILASVASWSHAAVAVIGVVAHKVWSKLVGAEAKLKAEVEKLAAEAKSKL